jgi:hypothetical protein
MPTLNKRWSAVAKLRAEASIVDGLPKNDPPRITRALPLLATQLLHGIG